MTAKTPIAIIVSSGSIRRNTIAAVARNATSVMSATQASRQSIPLTVCELMVTTMSLVPPSTSAEYLAPSVPRNRSHAIRRVTSLLVWYLMRVKTIIKPSLHR
jgi:hypothetical protein